LTVDAHEVFALQSRLAGADPQSILEAALARFERIALSFSGSEDVALVHMAAQIRPNLEVFTLDTGRLHPETYRLVEEVRERYPIRLSVLFPDQAAVERLVDEKGLFSFYRDGHQECCGIRKVAPLRRRLATLDAWITGQRRDQGATRRHLREVEPDATLSTTERPLVKLNPLANWSSAQVWSFIVNHEVPFNDLHRQGFVSIGCEPCSRPILPHQHEREGRWWWEDASAKECGLHAGNLAAGEDVST
jgi:phosphoadenosine phosphosulfate reductase